MTRRRVFEQVARGIALAALLGLLLLSWRPARGVGGQRAAGWRSLPTDSAAAWTLLRQAVLHGSVRAPAGSPGGSGGAVEMDTVALRIGGLPVGGLREGLATLSRRGMPIRWADGTGARGLAASLHPVAGAAASWRLQITGPAGVPILVSDSGGMLDSLVVPASGVAGWQFARLDGAATVRLPSSNLAVPRPRDGGGSAPRVVRLVSEPGWEAKFVAAALEEAGWRVDGALPVAPTATVQLGTLERLSPRTIAAVVVLDSAAADVAAVTRFVRAGGGLLLAGAAASTARWRALVPGAVGALEAGVAGALTGDRPRLGVAAYALRPAGDAVLLVADTLVAAPLTSEPRESRMTRPLVVARRVGDGRVAVSVLHETWRWRMQGRDDGAAAHRRWWVDLVEAVVGTSPSTDDRTAADWPGERAPYADLVARVGPPVDAPAMPNAARGDPAAPVALPSAQRWRIPLFLLALGALLVEWSSRRLRGAR